MIDRCFELITAVVHRFEGTINQYTRRPRNRSSSNSIETRGSHRRALETLWFRERCQVPLPGADARSPA